MRYVVKIGTKTMTDANGSIDQEFLVSLATQVASLWQQGVRIAIVASGAVALGYQQLGWGIYKTSETNISDLQQAAAVGQPFLMAHLNTAFVTQNLKVGQFLYTKDQLATSTLRNIIKSVLLRSLDKQSMMVPIINENDIITDEELKKIGEQGDNDLLCAEISKLIHADRVIYMTNVEGIKSANKTFVDQLNEHGVISYFKDADQLRIIRRELQESHDKNRHQISNGGMFSKFEQASILNGNGIPTWIVNGRSDQVLLRIHQDEKIGTLVDLNGKKTRKAK